MPNLKFSDGMEFNLSGPLRIERRSDGLYVIGNGMMQAVESREEGDALIASLQPTPKRPTVRLVGEDGNAFAIIGRVNEALRKAGYSKEERERFQNEATSGDYDNLLATCMRWVDVE